MKGVLKKTYTGPVTRFTAKIEAYFFLYCHGRNFIERMVQAAHGSVFDTITTRPDLYLNPPDRALLLCCDEKCQCQALERNQPGLPLSQGHIRTQTHDYYRHGTVTLFAALDYLSGKVFALTAPRHRHQEWLAFLRKIDHEVSAELDIRGIL